MGKVIFVRSGVLSAKYASMRRSLLSQCIQIGVALESASSDLDFLLENYQFGDVRFTPCNMFTLLAAPGIVREPMTIRGLFNHVKAAKFIWGA